MHEYKHKDDPRHVHDASLSYFWHHPWLTDIRRNRLNVVSAANYAMDENPEQMFIHAVTMISLIYAAHFLICVRFKL